MNVWWDVGVPVKHRGSCQITVFKGVIQQAWQTRYDRVHLTGNGKDLFPIIHHFPKEGLQTHYKALTHWLTARTCWKQASRDIRHQNTAIKLLQRCRSCTNSYINTVWLKTTYLTACGQVNATRYDTWSKTKYLDLLKTAPHRLVLSSGNISAQKKIRLVVFRKVFSILS